MDKKLMNKITEQIQAYINEQEKMGKTPNMEIILKIKLCYKN